MRSVSFRAGDTIISEGEVGGTAYLINSGSVKVTVGEGAKVQKLAELGTGDVFGEMSLIDPGPRSATVTALTDCVCVSTTHDELMGSIDEHSQWALEFLKTFVRRLRRMNELVTRMEPGRYSDAEYRRCVEEAMAAFRLRE
jgi:CRP/FNR family cyclic AMP-dependent transcriptional regulator